MGAGVAAAAAARPARTALAAARRLGGAARSLVSRAWGAFRRALPGLGLGGT
jgi:hypothetical protein